MDENEMAKKPEPRKHTAMVRITEHARDRAALAARLADVSLADYLTDLVEKHVEGDIKREAKRIAGGPDR